MRRAISSQVRLASTSAWYCSFSLVPCLPAQRAVTSHLAQTNHSKPERLLLHVNSTSQCILFSRFFISSRLEVIILCIAKACCYTVFSGGALVQATFLCGKGKCRDIFFCFSESCGFKLRRWNSLEITSGFSTFPESESSWKDCSSLSKDVLLMSESVNGFTAGAKVFRHTVN